MSNASSPNAVATRPLPDGTSRLSSPPQSRGHASPASMPSAFLRPLPSPLGHDRPMSGGILNCGSSHKELIIIHSLEQALERRDRLEEHMISRVPRWSLRPVVAALRTLRLGNGRRHHASCRDPRLPTLHQSPATRSSQALKQDMRIKISPIRESHPQILTKNKDALENTGRGTPYCRLLL